MGFLGSIGLGGFLEIPKETGNNGICAYSRGQKLVIINAKVSFSYREYVPLDQFQIATRRSDTFHPGSMVT